MTPAGRQLLADDRGKRCCAVLCRAVLCCGHCAVHAAWGARAGWAAWLCRSGTLGPPSPETQCPWLLAAWPSGGSGSLLRGPVNPAESPYAYALLPCCLSCTALQDIEPTWESILKLLDYNTGLARFARPGGWNDLDMLEGKLGRGRAGRLEGCLDLAAVPALLLYLILAALLQHLQACTDEPHPSPFPSCSGEWQADAGGAAHPFRAVGAAQVTAADWCRPAQHQSRQPGHSEGQGSDSSQPGSPGGGGRPDLGAGRQQGERGLRLSRGGSL